MYSRFFSKLASNTKVENETLKTPQNMISIKASASLAKVAAAGVVSVASAIEYFEQSEEKDVNASAGYKKK